MRILLFSGKGGVGKVERSRARGGVGEQYLDGPPGAIQLRAVDLFLCLPRGEASGGLKGSGCLKMGGVPFFNVDPRREGRITVYV